MESRPRSYVTYVSMIASTAKPASLADDSSPRDSPPVRRRSRPASLSDMCASWQQPVRMPSLQQRHAEQHHAQALGEPITGRRKSFPSRRSARFRCSEMRCDSCSLTCAMLLFHLLQWRLVVLVASRRNSSIAALLLGRQCGPPEARAVCADSARARTSEIVERDPS